MAVYASGTEFDHNFSKSWMMANWALSFWISVLYLAIIFSIRWWMSHRPGFHLQGPLFVWNLALAVFSIVGASHMLPELADILGHHGFGHSVCDTGVYTGTSGFWAWLFVLSKLPELGDTVFLVLRKRSLPFLHWYHHVTVLCYTWYSYADFTAPGRWFIAMNYLVHSIMYSYYALAALRVRLPALVSMSVTALQLTQMAVGCIVNVWAYRMKVHGHPCNVTNWNIVVSLLMYASYFTLFARFFHNAYLRKNRPLKKE